MAIATLDARHDVVFKTVSIEMNEFNVNNVEL